MEKLAIHGGNPIIGYKLPSLNDATGRYFGDEEKRQIQEVLETGRMGFISGDKVKEFQDQWAKLFGVNTAVAVSSGTAALHTAMVFLNIGPGDEVLVPAITDMGTVIAILLQNARPIFVDVDVITQNIDPVDMERKITQRTRAVIVVHMFGAPCDMDPIMEIARRRKIFIVEDACQAHFTEYKGKLVGTFGDVGCFSFQQTKHITTGDGGMVITNTDELCGRKLQLCSDKAWPRDQYRDHLFLAPNYHMTALQAAIGIAQLEKADLIIGNRRKTADILSSIIGLIDGVTVPPEGQGNRHTYFAYTFAIDPSKFATDNKGIAAALKAEGVSFSPSYLPQPLYMYDFLINRKTYGCTEFPFKSEHYPDELIYQENMCPVAHEACRRGMYFLWSERFTEEIATGIGNAIKKVLNHYKI